jgi:hypothetical protein
MGIVFFCQSCGARFEVDPRMAGKKGRCKKCGQFMAIPRADEITSMAAIPALAAASAGAGAAPSRASAAEAQSIASAFKGGMSKIVLAPISVDQMRIGPKKPSPLDDAQDSKPYALAQPLREHRGRARTHDNLALRIWRGQVGHLQKLFRKLNETAYLVSIPFIMLLLLGTVVRNRPMAMLGAATVVLLNVGRLVAGGINLALVPLRDGLDWSRLKKPLRRVIEPVLTICVVGLAFLFVPWLSTGESGGGGIGSRIRAVTDSLEKRTTEELDKAKSLAEGKTHP